jgi:NitT/TauT family transport system permease protein
MTSRAQRFDAVLFVVVLLAAWELFYLRVGDAGLASPPATFVQVGKLLADGGFWHNAQATAYAFLLAVVISLVGGLAIGLWFGLSRFAGDVADPMLNALSALPKITLYPVILLFFGLGMPAKVAFGTIHGIFPVIILTMNGVRNISPVIRKAARSMRLTPWQTMRTVLLPAALPEIFSGLRIGIALALLGTLIGELFASDRGIGFLLMQSVEHQDVPTIMALTLLLFAVAVLGGIGLLRVDRALHQER